MSSDKGDCFSRWTASKARSVNDRPHLLVTCRRTPRRPGLPIPRLSQSEDLRRALPRHFSSPPRALVFRSQLKLCTVTTLNNPSNRGISRSPHLAQKERALEPHLHSVHSIRTLVSCDWTWKPTRQLFLENPTILISGTQVYCTLGMVYGGIQRASAAMTHSRCTLPGTLHGVL